MADVVRDDATTNGAVNMHDNGRREYLCFGNAPEAVFGTMLDLSGARDYLGKCGLGNGLLTQARHLRGRSSEYAGYHISSERRCDFCGRYLTGIEYDVLKDGRERCAECASTTVVGRHQNVRLFEETKADMLQRFAIDINVSITVKVVDADEIARERGGSFHPTADMDKRAVGCTIKSRGTYTILLENGAPRIALVSTIVHELTHVWQHVHWDMGAIKRHYGRMAGAVCEGLAVWAEAQYLYLINESRHAKSFLEESAARTDEYGEGIKIYRAQYSISRGVTLEGPTPFEYVKEPIAKDILSRG